MTQDEAFLADIEANPNEPALRLIYADWLTEQGDPRGAYLRAEAELAALPADDGRRKKAQKRLKQMRAGLSTDWLARVERTAVENCEPRFEFECPKRWERLSLTGDDNVRFCETCRKPVFHCETVADAQRRAWNGQCVAIDSCTSRTSGDLRTGERQWRMGKIAPSEEYRPPRPPLSVVIRSGPLAGRRGVTGQRLTGKRVRVWLRLVDTPVILKLKVADLEVIPDEAAAQG
jgi:uncharacterized protein (TIGR02996 family)